MLMNNGVAKLWMLSLVKSLPAIFRLRIFAWHVYESSSSVLL